MWQRAHLLPGCVERCHLVQRVCKRRKRRELALLLDGVHVNVEGEQLAQQCCTQRRISRVRKRGRVCVRRVCQLAVRRRRHDAWHGAESLAGERQRIPGQLAARVYGQARARLHASGRPSSRRALRERAEARHHLLHSGDRMSPHSSDDLTVCIWSHDMSQHTAWSIRNAWAYVATRLACGHPTLRFRGELEELREYGVCAPRLHEPSVLRGRHDGARGQHVRVRRRVGEQIVRQQV